MCPCKMLKDILKKAKEIIENQKPDFKLVFEEFESYHTIDDIVFSVFES